MEEQNPNQQVPNPNANNPQGNQQHQRPNPNANNPQGNQQHQRPNPNTNNPQGGNYGPSQQRPQYGNGNRNTVDDIKSFFRNDFQNIVRLFMREPIRGTYALIQKKSPNAYFESLVLMGTVFVLFAFVPYILGGSDTRRSMDLEDMLFMGFVPVMFMFFVSFISFVIKSVSGKADFKSELFTGALIGFPLIFFLLFSIIIVMITGESFDESFDFTYFFKMGVLYVIGFLYILLMMINILQQSLKASGTNDAMAFYVSPAGIILAVYFTMVLIRDFFSDY